MRGMSTRSGTVCPLTFAHLGSETPKPGDTPGVGKDQDTTWVTAFRSHLPRPYPPAIRLAWTSTPCPSITAPGAPFMGHCSFAPPPSSLSSLSRMVNRYTCWTKLHHLSPPWLATRHLITLRVRFRRELGSKERWGGGWIISPVKTNPYQTNPMADPMGNLLSILYLRFNNIEFLTHVSFVSTF